MEVRDFSQTKHGPKKKKRPDQKCTKASTYFGSYRIFIFSFYGKGLVIGTFCKLMKLVNYIAINYNVKMNCFEILNTTFYHLPESSLDINDKIIINNSALLTQKHT